MKQKNYSAKECQDAFIVICETEGSYKEFYDSKVSQESSVPPYISIIGTLLDQKTIIIDFENITFKMNSLPKAIDICFKTYHLFSIEYPPAAQLIWQLINLCFYNMKDEKTYPAVHMLTKMIKGILIIKFTFTFFKFKI